jgi:hypothetical protein
MPSVPSSCEAACRCMCGCVCVCMCVCMMMVGNGSVVVCARPWRLLHLDIHAPLLSKPVWAGCIDIGSRKVCGNWARRGQGYAVTELRTRRRACFCLKTASVCPTTLLPEGRRWGRAPSGRACRSAATTSTVNA